MASPKKKLSGKVLIEVPGSEPLNLAQVQSDQESSKQESSKPSLPANSKPDSCLESGSQLREVVAQKQGSGKQESVKEETSKDVYKIPSLPESRLPESIKDYKKVAMRLSTTAAEKLRQLRADTGIPYEILVDVMIRHWDDLAKKTKAE